jgi:hypothetical protein
MLSQQDGRLMTLVLGGYVKESAIGRKPSGESVAKIHRTARAFLLQDDSQR